MRLLGAIAVSLLLCGTAVAQEGWTSLKARTETVKIEGQKVALGLAPSFRIADDVLSVRLIVDLADFQRKAPAILAHLADRKSKKCGMRWSFPDLPAPKFANGKLRFEGKLRAEQRACALGAKTRLWRETADFVLSAAPVAVENHVEFDATVEAFDLGKSVFKEIGAADQVKTFVQGAVKDLMADDDLRLDFPKEVRDLNPKLEAVSLQAGQGGNAQLAVSATVKADAKMLQDLGKLLLSQ
jgi:hypothetical protein